MNILIIIIGMLVNILLKLNSLNKRLHVIWLKEEKLRAKLDAYTKQLDKIYDNI